jgi:hypothetical protein
MLTTTTTNAVPHIKQGRSRALCAAGGALVAALAWIVEVPLLGIHLNFRFGTGHTQAIAIGQVIGVAVAASLLGWLLLALLGAPRVPGSSGPPSRWRRWLRRWRCRWPPRAPPQPSPGSS